MKVLFAQGSFSFFTSNCCCLSPSHGAVCSLARLSLQLVVKCILALFLTVVGQCITLDVGNVNVLRLYFDLHRADVDHALLHSFPKHNSDSLLVVVVVSTAV